uniref:Uncharacterized protein LOC104216685 n=1 Tax=Nicotiana sylvestris TaxID=4096 RepID=A0A1U7VFF8_NICSY|nr:PREDICTED: uncharacterized protein LOC104216685 [Nicotiana sylvestris]
MGFSKKTTSHHPMDGNIKESETKGWIIAGITLRSPLKPIFTTKNKNKHVEDEEEEEEEFSTTPTYEESRLSSRNLTCPPAPKKRKTSSRCNYTREFFQPPRDLESVFIRRVEF